jgi:hypothetical protein
MQGSEEKRAVTKSHLGSTNQVPNWQNFIRTLSETRAKFWRKKKVAEKS